MVKINRGFALIELMTVIAIIGVLSSIFLASLSNSRSKAANTSIKANLSNARAQAELYYDTNNESYAGLCGTVPVNGVSTIREHVNAAHSTSIATNITYNLVPSQTNTTYTVCHARAADWAVSVPLKVPEVVGGSTLYYWCVDWTGFSKGRNLPLNANYTCPIS